ncbi:malate dehydrogenase, cytoplasmic-like [Pecten maximus]|uniref:malate dehydrogenase, cytoplasmic-like n=1 Tax=Pecten maximus TaxID=6579 RepID=UPI0014584506|nr:malate dehydrogenase, cytoplasmic-like [Pecten maximus]
MADPVIVVITGAAGQIAYSLLYNVAKGDVFGKNQKVVLRLLDIGPMMGVLKGVEMEINDCAFPLVSDVVATDDPGTAFSGADVAMLVGAMPRREGMERKDLLKANAKIFKSQGECIDKVAKKSIKVVVVGNPANTNALICAQSAPSIPRENFSALTRLDQNRAQAQVAAKLGIACDAVKDIVIWGNHSSTQFPDLSYAKVLDGEDWVEASSKIQDDDWIHNEFVKTVQTRGAAVIAARKLSSAMSAAKAIGDHVKDWWNGTGPRIVSMGVMSDGKSYGIEEGLMYSFPVKIEGKGVYKIVEGLNINDWQRKMMDVTAEELSNEKKDAFQFLLSE